MNETLRIDLPKSIATDDTTIVARRYPCSIFIDQHSVYQQIGIPSITYAPSTALVEAVTTRDGIEITRNMGANGVIPINVYTTRESPIQLDLYNLSTDAQVSLTVNIQAY